MGNFLLFSRTVTGKQIAITVTILNTRRLSHKRLYSQIIVSFPPSHQKFPFPQLACHLSSNLSVVQEHKELKQRNPKLGGYKLCLGMLNITTVLLWKASLLP